MRHIREDGFNRIHGVSSKRAVSILITLLLLSGTVRASESNWQAVAEDLKRRGDLIGAERVLQTALREAGAAGPRSVQVGGALAALGVFYQDIGRFAQAESCFTSSLGIFREVVGSDDLALAPLVIHLAWLYVETGRPGAARRLQPEAWVDRLTLHDPESRFLPMLLETVAGVNALEGRFDIAQKVYKQNFDLLTGRGASGSVEMASALNNFGFIQLRAGQYNDASSHFARALDLWLRLTKPNDLQVAMSRLGLAGAHIAVGRYRQAGDLLNEILPVFEHNCGPNSLRTEDIVTRYAQVLRRQKRDNEAAKLEERARLIRRASAADLSYKHVIDARDIGKTDRPVDDSSRRPRQPVKSLGEPVERRPVLITRPTMRRS